MPFRTFISALRFDNVTAKEKEMSLDLRRRFYTGMAVAAIAIVFAGFARTYFLKAYTGTPSQPFAVHVHAVVFTAWLLLFLTQTTLIANGRTAVHRRFGAVMAALAVLMVVVGYLVAISSARRGFRGIFAAPAPGTGEALSFLIISIVDLLLFAAFVGAGFYFRKRSEVHKRLMLLGTINLLPAAMTRLPLGAARLPMVPILLVVFLMAAPLRDRIARLRMHPVSVWGGLVIFLSVPLRLAIGATDIWQRFAAWLIS